MPASTLAGASGIPRVEYLMRSMICESWGMSITRSGITHFASGSNAIVEVAISLFFQIIAM